MAEWARFPAKFDSSCKRCRCETKQGDIIWGAKGMPGVKASAWFVVCESCYNEFYKHETEVKPPSVDFDAGLTSAIKGSESKESFSDLISLLKDNERLESTPVSTADFAPVKEEKFVIKHVPYSIAWIEQNASWRM